MIKKVSLIISLVIFCITCFICYSYFASQDINNFFINTSTFDKLQNSHEKSDTIFINSLYFNQNRLLYDKNNNTWYYSVSENNIGKKINIKYKSKYKDLKMAIINFPTTKQDYNDFIQNNKYALIAFYTKHKIHISSIKITTLPLINIVYNDKKTLSKLNDTPINFYLYNNSKASSNTIIKSKGLMHIRGAFSKGLPKNSYKLKLTKSSQGKHRRKNKISLLNMRQDDDWILYSPYSDIEKVRNVFAMNLWKDITSNNNLFHIQNASEFKFVELFLNNSYHGLYALGYQLDAKAQKLKKDTNGHYTEFLFKKFWWDRSEYEKQTIPFVMDGYELRSKNETTNSTPRPFNEQELNTHEKSFLNSNIKAWKTINNFYKQLTESNSTKTIYKIIDINNAIDIYLLINFMQNCDTVNYFVYPPTSLKHVFLTFKQYKNDYKLLYSLWDLEAIFGTSTHTSTFFHPNGLTPYFITPEQNFIMDIGPVVYLQKLNDPKINKLVKKRYSELRKTYLSQNYLMNLLNQYEKQIYNSGAYLREKNKWPNATYSESDIKLNRLNEYVNKRLYYMDKFINTLK